MEEIRNVENPRALVSSLAISNAGGIVTGLSGQQTENDMTTKVKHKYYRSNVQYETNQVQDQEQRRFR